MVLPVGLPAWSGTATPEQYGGHADKRNLGDIGAVNARTDVSAEQWNRIATDLTAAVRGAPLFWIYGRVTSGGGITDNTYQVINCQPQWAPASGPYDGATPPSNLYPIVVDSGDHISAIIEFTGLGSPPSVSDDYGVSSEFNVRSILISSSEYGVGQFIPVLPTAWTVIMGTTDGEYFNLIARG